MTADDLNPALKLRQEAITMAQEIHLKQCELAAKERQILGVCTHCLQNMRSVTSGDTCPICYKDIE